MHPRPSLLYRSVLCGLLTLAIALGLVSAAAASPKYELAVTINGQGSVVRIPDEALYPEGAFVTLIANAALNWHFAGWSGDTVAYDPALTLSMDADRSVTATFEVYLDTLTVSVVGNGSVTRQPGGPAYAHGSLVVLTALSNPGYHFESWSGDTASVANPLTFVVHASASVVATFVPNDPTVALPEGFISQEIVVGMDQPVGMEFLPDGRLLVVERESGYIRMLVDGHISTVDPVCAVDSVSTDGGERGLLGIAVDPGWPARPFVYVAYTALGNTIRLSRFEASGHLDDGLSDSLTIDPATRYDVLRELQDLLEFHNGGGLHFGPDGMLYQTIGDDGDDCAAQDSTRLKGVMLRLDVRSLPLSAGGPPDRDALVPPDNPFAGSDLVDRRLIFAEGLRNPFSFDIDPATGTVFAADVGYTSFEEINLISPAGANYGWPMFEGPDPHTPECVTEYPHGDALVPIYAYDRPNLAAAVISAGVYHGRACTSCNFPQEYEGDYFFADFYQGFIRRLRKVDGAWLPAPPAPGQPGALNWGLGLRELADFAVGPDGALWYCRTAVEFTPGTGGIGRILHQGDFVGVADGPAPVLAFAAPYPSPARNRVHFQFVLPAAATVDVEVFDVTGRRVRQLLRDAPRPAGRTDVTWDARSEDGTLAAPGVYLARLASGLHVVTRRVIVVR